MTGDTQGLNHQLAEALAQVGEQWGKKLDIRSGFRSRQEQEVLYQKYLNHTGNLAAKPGTSNHESGNAADVYVDGEALSSHPQASKIAAQVGLKSPVPGEPWHAAVAPAGW
ncbi:MAG: M15 family metallopeptidase [Candidatus Eremiobacterota bacterium]